jgi:hypothetical protein
MNIPQAPRSGGSPRPAGQPDLTELIENYGDDAVSALGRAMFDPRATPANRIRAARAFLEIALQEIESESRRPKRKTAYRCGDLLIAAIEKMRARWRQWQEDIDREDELRKSMGQPPLTEDEKQEQLRAREAQET